MSPRRFLPAVKTFQNLSGIKEDETDKAHVIVSGTHIVAATHATNTTSRLLRESMCKEFLMMNDDDLSPESNRFITQIILRCLRAGRAKFRDAYREPGHDSASYRLAKEAAAHLFANLHNFMNINYKMEVRYICTDEFVIDSVTKMETTPRNFATEEPENVFADSKNLVRRHLDILNGEFRENHKGSDKKDEDAFALSAAQRTYSKRPSTCEAQVSHPFPDTPRAPKKRRISDIRTQAIRKEPSHVRIASVRVMRGRDVPTQPKKPIPQWAQVTLRSFFGGGRQLQDKDIPQFMAGGFSNDFRQMLIESKQLSDLKKKINQARYSVERFENDFFEQQPRRMVMNAISQSVNIFPDLAKLNIPLAQCMTGEKPKTPEIPDEFKSGNWEECQQSLEYRSWLASDEFVAWRDYHVQLREKLQCWVSARVAAESILELSFSDEKPSLDPEDPEPVDILLMQPPLTRSTPLQTSRPSPPKVFSSHLSPSHASPGSTAGRPAITKSSTHSASIKSREAKLAEAAVRVALVRAILSGSEDLRPSRDWHIRREELCRRQLELGPSGLRATEELKFFAIRKIKENGVWGLELKDRTTPDAATQLKQFWDYMDKEWPRTTSDPAKSVCLPPKAMVEYMRIVLSGIDVGSLLALSRMMGNTPPDEPTPKPQTRVLRRWFNHHWSVYFESKEIGFKYFLSCLAFAEAWRIFIPERFKTDMESRANEFMDGSDEAKDLRVATEKFRQIRIAEETIKKREDAFEDDIKRYINAGNAAGIARKGEPPVDMNSRRAKKRRFAELQQPPLKRQRTKASVNRPAITTYIKQSFSYI